MKIALVLVIYLPIFSCQGSKDAFLFPDQIARRDKSSNPNVTIYDSKHYQHKSPKFPNSRTGDTSFGGSYDVHPSGSGASGSASFSSSYGEHGGHSSQSHSFSFSGNNGGFSASHSSSQAHSFNNKSPAHRQEYPGFSVSQASSQSSSFAGNLAGFSHSSSASSQASSFSVDQPYNNASPSDFSDTASVSQSSANSHSVSASSKPRQDNGNKPSPPDVYDHHTFSLQEEDIRRIKSENNSHNENHKNLRKHKPVTINVWDIYKSLQNEDFDIFGNY